MELFLLCSDDAESDVRMVADECLNRVIKVSPCEPCSPSCDVAERTDRVWRGGVALDVRRRSFAAWLPACLSPLLTQKAVCAPKSQMGSTGSRSVFLGKMSLQTPASVWAEPRAATRPWEGRGQVNAVCLWCL